MKIVLLYLGRTGAGPTYSIEYAKALLKKDINLYAIVSSCAENINDWRALSRDYNQEQFLLKEIHTYQSKSEFIYRSLNFKLYRSLVKSITKYTPDCIVSTMVHPWHNIIYFLLRNKITRIKIIHDVKPHIGENNFAYRILNYLDISISDFWIVLTQTSRESLVKQGIEVSNICVIPHANFACYAKDEIEISKSLFYRMAFIGRINKYKGLNILLEAFRNVRNKIPKLKLSISGNGDCAEYEPLFKELSDALELDIRWIPDSEIPDKIKDVDFVVLPYIDATQSGVIPLAYAFGKTVIATDVGGIKEQVPADVGILIPPSDSIALGNAIMKLYDNPNEILRLGRNAYRYSREELSWEKSADLLIAFIQHTKEISSRS